MVIALELESFSHNEGSNYLQMLLQVAIVDGTKDIYFCPEEKQTRIFHDAAQGRAVPIGKLEDVLSDAFLEKIVEKHPGLILPSRPKNIPEDFYEATPLPNSLFKKMEKFLSDFYGVKDIKKLDREVSKQIKFGTNLRRLDMTIRLDRSQEGNYHLNLDY